MFSVNFALIIVLIFIVLLIFSFFIEDSNLKLCYWLVVMLLALTIFNIILSYTYYTRLREEPGVQGPRGPAGDPGPKGNPGVCTVSEKCNIQGCKQKIVDMAHDIFPNVSKRCLGNAHKCSNKELSLGKPLNATVKKLTLRCQKTKMAEPDFMKSIRPIIRLQEDGDIKN